MSKHPAYFALTQSTRSSCLELLPTATMAMKLTTTVALALALASSQAFGQQQVLASSHRVFSNEPVNITELFSVERLNQATWTREAWNGLTTFARSAPLRCFGADEDSPYDVAVIGTLV